MDKIGKKTIREILLIGASFRNKGAEASAMAFMYALDTFGVSSCPVNWPDIAGREMKIARAPGLAPCERIVLVMAIGYPDPEGLVACSQKKSLDDFRSYGRKVFR